MYWAAWQEQVGPHALRHAISAYVDAHNDEGKPFKWTKTADEILARGGAAGESGSDSAPFKSTVAPDDQRLFEEIKDQGD